MPINSHLSPTEHAIHRAAKTFASGPLKSARQTYTQHTSPAARFQSTRPIYRQAIATGLIKGQIPPHLGGTGGSLTEAAILVEELYAVEPSASLTIFATGLGLTPLNLVAKKPEEFGWVLEPFLSGEGEPLASLVFSEPGGVANYLERGAPGLGTTARWNEEGGEWILNGEKVCMLASRRRLC